MIFSLRHDPCVLGQSDALPVLYLPEIVGEGYDEFSNRLEVKKGQHSVESQNDLFGLRLNVCEHVFVSVQIANFKVKAFT